LPSLSPRQIKLATLSLVVLLAALAFVARHAGDTSIARAQEPSPTATRTATAIASATPSGTAAAGTCSGAIRGGQTAPAPGGASITLPAGGTYDILTGPSGEPDPTFTVCHKESQARVTINAQTCREVSESVPNASGALIVAQIVESCTTTATAGSTAVATQTPGAIQPPSTGEAGLRN
jgi:hypothetical protein